MGTVCCGPGDLTHFVRSRGHVHPPRLPKYGVRQIFRVSGRMEPFNIAGTPERNMYIPFR